MTSSSSPELPAISPREFHATLTRARSLLRAAKAGQTQPLLRGRNLGLLCEGDEAEADLFCRAAAELGAHVAHIRPHLDDSSTPPDVEHTAHLLGRLYDAVECQGMTPALVQQLQAGAGVPVYDGIAASRHPSAGLAKQLAEEAGEADSRRFIVQAVLLDSLGL
jgi:ornithine carbamoyltransferase